MNTILRTRLTKLEKQSLSGNPLAHLSDEELDGRVSELSARIEAKVGMPISDYAEALHQAIEASHPLPGGISIADCLCFVAAIRKDAGRSGAHVE